MGMKFQPPVRKLGDQPPCIGGTTTSLLEDAIASFSANRGSAIAKIQRLRLSDPSGVAHSAVHVLESAEADSRVFLDAVGLIATGNLLVELLMNTQIWSLGDAVVLARKLPLLEPRLDVRLVRQVLGKAGDGVGSITSDEALRLLGLIDATSDCSVLASYLIQFQRHPSDKVRSKAVLMLGRSNCNPGRVEGLLASEDSRLRANAVESLWGHRSQAARQILWNATQDPHARVAVNALLGLCRTGENEACSRLGELADAFDPALRLSAAWAMGETGDRQFAEPLEKLAQDQDAKVRERAEKSQKKLPPLTPVVPPGSETKADATGSEPEGDSVLVKPPNGWLTGAAEP
jgi:hypothetical protein